MFKKVSQLFSSLIMKFCDIEKKCNTQTGTSASINGDEWYYNYHAVACLDILGQREAFKEVKGVIPQDSREKDKLTVALKKTVEFVHRFRKGFKDIFEGYSKGTGMEKELPVEFRDEFLKLRQSSINLYGLSDAVVVWTSLKGDSHQCVAMNSLYGMLMASAGMFVISLASKHAIRGGIEIEGAITLEAGSFEIYGPALYRAYELESEHAQHPRILVGEGVMNYLKTIIAIESKERPSLHSKEIAERCLQLITKDHDGRNMVDYLGREILMTAPDALREKEVLIPARQFIKEQIEWWHLNGNSKLVERYKRVLSYFDDRLPHLKNT